MANIIFDFDGTIADSLPTVVAMFNAWVRHRGPVETDELQKLRDMPIARALEVLRIPPWKATALLIRGRRSVSKHIKDIPVFSGIPALLRDLHDEGHELYIMSSNSTHNIHLFLESHQLNHYFKKVYGSVGLFGKQSVLKKITKYNHLDIRATYYIGDESRDIRAAQRAGIRAIAVTWGYNGEKLLSNHHPYAIARHSSDLKRILI